MNNYNFYSKVGTERNMLSAQNMNGLWRMAWTQKCPRKLHEVSLGALPKVPIVIKEHTQDICMLTDTMTETYEIMFENTKAWWVMHGHLQVYIRETNGYDIEVQYTNGKLLGDPYAMPFKVGGYANRTIDLTHSNQIFSVIVIDPSGRVDRDPMEQLVYHKRILPERDDYYII